MKSMVFQRILILVFAITFCAGETLAQSEGKVRGIAVMIDNTGSMRPALPRIVEIANEIVDRIEEKAAISLIAFKTLPDTELAGASVLLECSTDKLAIENQLAKPGIVGGQTILYSSIGGASARLGLKKPPNCPEYSSNILVLISDGEDRVSRIQPKELFVELRNNGTVVHVVGLIDDLPDDGRDSPKKKAKSFLEDIARETGGTIVFPKRKMTSKEIAKLIP